jgi:hypothetical protein
VNREIDLKEVKDESDKMREHWKRGKTEWQKRKKRNASISVRNGMEAWERQKKRKEKKRLNKCESCHGGKRRAAWSC